MKAFLVSLLLIVLFGRGDNAENYKRQNSGLFFLPENYDKYVSPQHGSGTPLEIKVSMYLLDVWVVSEENMEVSMDLYFRQNWKDPRLAFSHVEGAKPMSFGPEVADKLWLPDTFFANAKETKVTETYKRNTFIRISPDGDVLHSVKLHIIVGCHMDLYNFPLDTQMCSLEMESYGHKAEEIIYKWSQSPSAVGFYEGVGLPKFEIKKIRNRESHISVSSGNYSRLCSELELQRQPRFYLYHYYMPAIFLVLVSWLALFVKRESATARCLIALVPMALLIFHWFSMTFPLRHSAVSTKLDCYMVTSLLFTIAVLVQSVIVMRLPQTVVSPSEEASTNTQDHRIQIEEKDSQKKSKMHLLTQKMKKITSVTHENVDLACRFLFPLVFALYNIGYWLR